MTRFHIVVVVFVAPVRWIRREAADKTFVTHYKPPRKTITIDPLYCWLIWTAVPIRNFYSEARAFFNLPLRIPPAPSIILDFFPTKRNPVIRDGQKDVRFAVQVVADRRFGRWQDLHSVQVLRRCVHYYVHLDHWWVGDVRFRQLNLICLIYSRVLLMSHIL